MTTIASNEGGALPTRETQNVRVLFLGGGKRVSLAEHLIEQGRAAGWPIRIFSYERDDLVPIRDTATVIHGMRWENCIEHLEKTVAEHGIHIVIPFVDPAIAIACRLQERGIPVFCPVSASQACELFFSKKRTSQWCVQNAIPVPLAVPGRFPQIAKPDFGSASRGLVMIHDEQQAQRYANSGTHLLQQFVDGREYSVDIYRSVSHGNINYLVTRERLEMQGGEAIKSKTVRHDTIEQLARAILQRSGLVGAVTLQFLEDKHNGRVYFMEANPRFGGGVVTAVGSGVDIASVLLADWKGERLDEELKWEPNVLMLRRFSEIFVHANHH